jgi:hypothetical protein
MTVGLDFLCREKGEKLRETREAAESEGRGRRGARVPGDLDLGVVEKEEGAGEMVVGGSEHALCVLLYGEDDIKPSR